MTHDNLCTLRDSALSWRGLSRLCPSRVNRQLAASALRDFRAAMLAAGASPARILRSIS